MFTNLRKKLSDKPIVSFIIFLALLFSLIVIIDYSRKPKDEEVKETVAKEVVVFSIGEKPTIITQARVDESGATQIVTQAPGIVSKIHVSEGDNVSRGTRLVSIGNNYQGGNAAAVQSQMAARQLQNVNETLDTQKELIQIQKDIAHKVDENTDELRNIAGQSIDDTQDLVNLNNDMLTTIEDNLKLLEDNNQGGEFDEQIAELKQAEAMLSGQQIQIETGLRNVQYQTSDDNPPAELSNLQKDATLKQIDLQEKALYLGKDLAELQLTAARIGASIFYPSSPVSGTVEKVHVIQNQAVAPGMPLVTINNSDGSYILSVQITQDLAPFVSSTQPAKLVIGDTETYITSSYVSSIPTEGNLFTIKYELDTLPDDTSLVKGGFVNIHIPLFGNCQDVNTCFIPIESVKQTQEAAYVYVVENDKAVLKEVVLGSIIGSFVEILEGLEPTDLVIVSRNVIDGDVVSFEN